MNDDTKFILSLLRDIQSNIAGSMENLEKQITTGLANMDGRLKALEDQHRANFSSLHSISGHIHTKVSADEALPEYLLNKEIMLDFIENYPKNGPSPLSDKRQKQLQRNREAVAGEDTEAMIKGYAAMREQSSLTNTDLYYHREVEALLAEELHSRGKDLFKDHEPRDPNLLQVLKDREKTRDVEHDRAWEKNLER